MLIHLTNDISHLIKLSFNTPKFTRGLDPLSILLAYSSPGRRQAGKDMQGMSVPRQADPHAGTDAANDPALMALRCVGAGHHGAISRHRRRFGSSMSPSTSSPSGRKQPQWSKSTSNPL
jgi:hypothetical protein